MQYLDRRWKQEQEREYFRTGIIASTVANFAFSPPKEPIRPTDYMPGASKPEPELTDEQIAERINAALLPISIVKEA